MQYTAFKRGAAVGLMALMLATAVPAPQAHAATMDQLQAQINALLAQIASLQSQVGGTGSSASCSPFVSDLTIGRTGAEVTKLQNFLISKGFTIPAGATGYFGGQTQSALAKFQAANGIAPAVGYFGPLTRAKVNTMCTPTTPTTPTNPDNGGTPTTPSEDTLRGEASLDDFEAKDGEDTNLEEGQKNAEVAEFHFEVVEGDVRINRIDLGFTPGSLNNEKDPWDTFSEIAIYSGSERIAKVNASDKSNWTKNSPASGDFRIRFSGVSKIFKEDTEVKLTAKVTLLKSIKGANDGETWEIFVPTNGIRGLDADKASVYTGDTSDRVSFDIDEAGHEDEIIIKRSDKDLDSTTLALKSNAKSGWTTVFAFDIDTDDSTNDIEIGKIPVSFTVGSSTLNTFMRDARIIVDGKTFTKKTVVDGSTGVVTFEFDNNDLVIDAGDRVTAEVQIDFKALQSAYEGTTIVASVNASNIEAEGADDLTGSQLSGTATGETHTMRTQGVILKGQSTNATNKDNTQNSMEDDEGVFSIKFDVTAFESDIFVARATERGTTLGSAGVNYTIEDSSLGGSETASGTVTAVLTSNAKVEGSFYKVAEGETKSFTLNVVYNPEYQSFFNLQLHSINWSKTAVAPTTQQLALPDWKFETTQLSINN